MLELDHIAVLGETLDDAVAHVENRLGQSMLPGGRHARYGTHNRLLGMAPHLYVESIAIDPEAAPPHDPRWFGLDRFRGPARLAKWICRVSDLDAALSVLPMAGRKVDLARGELRWSMAVPEDGDLPFDGVFPALIQWHSATPPGFALPSGSRTLRDLIVTHPEADRLSALLAPYLNAPLVRFETAGSAGVSARLTVDEREVWL